MKKISRRTILSTTGTALLLAACAALIIVLQNRTPESPYADDPDPKISGIKTDKSLPEDTVSPAQILDEKKPTSKVVTVRGLLIRTKDGKTFIADQEDNKALTVDLSAVPNSDKYINDLLSGSDDASTGNVANPVSVTGTIKMSDKKSGSQKTLFVQKITE